MNYKSQETSRDSFFHISFAFSRIRNSKMINYIFWIFGCPRTRENEPYFSTVFIALDAVIAHINKSRFNFIYESLMASKDSFFGTSFASWRVRNSNPYRISFLDFKSLYGPESHQELSLISAN